MMDDESNILGLCICNTNYIQQLVREGGAKFALNQSQCTCLGQTLEQITRNIANIFSHANEFLSNCDLLLRELFRIIDRAKLLVQECYGEKWWHATLLQIHNEEAFQDLLRDLISCHDDIYQHLKGQWVGLFDQFKNDMSFSLNTMSEQGVEDHRVLVRRLQASVESRPSCSTNKDLEEEFSIAAYLLKRYDNQLNYVNGYHHVEVDAQLGWGRSISLASGAFGSVEKTTWFGLPCAKKMQVLGEGLEDGDKIFKREVGILASVNHPNVVKFICCCRKQEERKCFIAMELLDTSLEDLIKEVSNGGTRTPFPIQVAMDIIIQIAKGMSYLHEKKITHRDLKPANVLVRKTMVDKSFKDNYVNVKLADFGLSKMDVYSNISKELSQGIGSRLYKAPELFQNNKRKRENMYSLVEKVNAHEADVYSFGVMCATILSGKKPFEGDDHDLPTRLRSGERPQVPEDCPEALVSLINECWSLDRTKRPIFKEICLTLEVLRSSILRGDVVLRNQEVKHETTVFKRISNLPHNIMYMLKRFWRTPTLEGSEANEAQNTSQIHTKGFQVFAPSSWANRILPSQVRSTHSLPSLPIHFVNIDKKISNVLFQLNSNHILGIVGMGGSGKTTLTKAILHRVHQDFEATSFVANMRDSKNVLDIQTQLLKDLNYTSSISTIEEGFKCLQNIFEKKKVFVVFDDVASEEQLHGLVSSTWLFANGSKIIATSRNWQDLKTTCVSHTGKMDMELLDEDEAKELFYKHAFSHQQPQGLQFEEVANKVIEACGGLPLSLEVLGGYLCGVKWLRVWQEALQRLQKGKCLGGSWDNERIWRTLRISYDNLDEEEKNMFLDIACFFCRDVLEEGMQEEKALTIWDSDDSNAHSALLNLMDRSLVRIDSDGMLAMHDHLRDMGCMIACKEHIGGQRIWNMDELEPTKSDACMMIQNVEGLYTDGSRCNYNMITTLDMANIRLLHMKDCENLDCLYKTMKNASKLRWMRINMYCEKIEELQPSFFIPFKQLCVLEMKGFLHLEHLPSEIGTLEMLNYLTLIFWMGLEFLPETLGNLTSLVELNLSGCWSLKELPETLGNLISLVKLEMINCMDLEKLPDTLGNLTSLLKLDMIGCSSLQVLPDTLGNLTSLVELYLSGCSNLEELPETLGNLTSLVELYLNGCSYLGELPETLGNLTSLVELGMSGWSDLEELPDTLGNLSSLVELNMSGCSCLKELPDTLGNLSSLVKLDMSDCSSLKGLPETLGKLTSLVELHMSGISSLKELPETLGNLTSLVELHMSDFSSWKELPETLGNLTSLVQLHMTRLWYLKELPETLGNLTSLVQLHISDCLRLEELPKILGNLTLLVELDMGRCESLKELPETLGNLTSLVYLNMGLCSGLEVLPETLGNLTSLVELQMSGCSSLKELPETLGNLTSLVKLDMSRCRSLKELPKTLGNLTSLVKLDMSYCSSLKELPDTLGNLTSLVELHMSGFSSLKELPETLGNLTSLVEMSFRWCQSLKELPETLGNLSSLVRLDMSYCKSLKVLPETLGNLTSLVKLDMSGCESLKVLPETLGNLTSLVKLDMRFCWSLKELPETLRELEGITRDIGQFDSIC